MDPRITLITLGVKDLKKAREFYGKGLGWKESGAGNDSVAFFQLNGGVALGLLGREALAEDAHLKNAGSGFDSNFGGITIAQNQRSKAEVDAVIAAAVKAGATLLKPAQDVFWGGYSGYFADPDGHPWEIAWNPFFPMDAAGGVVLPK